jgi:predicted permease
MNKSRPPGGFPQLAARLVGWLLPRRYREEVLADLTEEWLVLARSRGVLSAGITYWRDACLSVFASWWHVLRFGGSLRPSVTEGDGWLFIGLYDWRQTVRALVRTPRFTIAALLTLMLGIGATVTVFSLVNTVLLRPLPFRDADALVQLETLRGGERGKISMREIADLRERSTAFVDVAAYVPGAQYSVAEGPVPQKATAILATRNLFRVLGTPMLLGDTFPESYDRERHNALILSHRTWQQQFASDRTIVGRTVVIDASPEAAPRYAVTGVLAPGFDFPARTDLYRSAFIHTGFPDNVHREVRNAIGLGRLRPGVTLAGARDELARISHHLSGEFPTSNEAVSLTLTPLREVYVGPVRPYALVLLAAASILLLIACVNVANLFLSRALDRQPQLAVRRALGASRARLVAQACLEGASLALVAGALGAGLAYICVSTLGAVMQMDLPSWMVLRIDDRNVLLFALAVSFVTGLVTTVVPALSITASSDGETLRAAGSRAIGSARQGRLRRALVVGEIAVSVILLIGAGLMAQTFRALWASDVGFEPRGLLTFKVALPAYYSGTRALQFQQELLERLNALPGVMGAAMNANLPLAQVGQADRQSVVVEGQDVAAVAGNPYVNYQRVSQTYFDVMGVPILLGRAFDNRDVAGGALVALISGRFAERFWPGQDPIGRRLRQPGDDAWRVVIGVAGDVRHQSASATPGFDVYLAATQGTEAWSHFVVRTADEQPRALTNDVQRAVWALNPRQPVTDIVSMQKRMLDTAWQQRASAFVLGVFASLALVLASVGIYGVMSYSVGQRVREFGLRRALGAQGRDLALVVLREIGTTAAVGVIVGVTLAATAAHAIRPLLYGVAPTDALTFAAVPLVVGLLALVASAGPARRASRIDPLTALRSD